MRILFISGMFIADGLVGYSFVARSFKSVYTISFAFTGAVFPSEELLTSSTGGAFCVGTWAEALVEMLVFAALVEARAFDT